MVAETRTPEAAGTPRRRQALLLLGLSYLGFVSLGLPDGLLGVAWPSIRATFSLPLDALGVLLVSTTAGYVASSFSSGPILARMNLGALLALSAAATAGSLIGYALAPAWGVMVACGCVAGLGAGAIDAGLNSHVARHHSTRTLNLLHAWYGLGTTAGPLLMTSVLMAGSPWQRGYLLVASGQLALAASFAASRKLWTGAETARVATPTRVPGRSTLRLPAAQLGVLAFFLYTGLEAAAGAWTFALLHEARGIGMGAAGGGTSLFWAGLMTGRVALGLFPREVSHAWVVRSSSGGMLLAATLLSLDLGETPTLAALGLLGICAGPIFPTLIAATPRRLGGAHTANAVGFQIAAAALGQSMLPALLGWLAAGSSLEVVPVALAAGALALLAIHEGLVRSASACPEPA